VRKQYPKVLMKLIPFRHHEILAIVQYVTDLSAILMSLKTRKCAHLTMGSIAYIKAAAPKTRAIIPPETRFAMPALAWGTEVGAELEDELEVVVEVAVDLAAVVVADLEGVMLVEEAAELVGLVMVVMVVEEAVEVEVLVEVCAVVVVVEDAAEVVAVPVAPATTKRGRKLYWLSFESSMISMV
jgi:SOS-response transcriptional repressor LexA